LFKENNLLYHLKCTILVWQTHLWYCRGYLFFNISYWPGELCNVHYVAQHTSTNHKIQSTQIFTSGVLMAMTTEMTVFWNVQFDRYLSLIYLSLHYKYLSQIWHTFGITCWEFSWVTHFLTLLRIGTICVFIHHNTHSVNFNII
jgi:hypothetical protein